MHSDCRFEVGKKYRRVGKVVKGHECVFAQASLSVVRQRPVGIAILKNEEDGVLYHVDEEDWHHWELVEEPRVEYFNAYKNPLSCHGKKVYYGNPYLTVEEADKALGRRDDPLYYGRLKMTHYSDRVDVEFHLKRK